MIANQLPLLRRELWEHRAIYVTPLVIGLLIALMAITGQTTISANDHVVELALWGAAYMQEAQRAAMITAMTFGIAGLLALAMLALAVFYCLDALYAERKDRSILFWRSMPVTDAETVVSKLVTALFVIPLVTCAVTFATHLVVLATASAWMAVHGANPWDLLWSTAPLGEIWLATLAFFIGMPLWLSPFAGWFLLVSAWTRRSPLLLGFLPIVVLPMLEKSLIGSRVLADAFFQRSVEMPLFRGLGAGPFMLRGDALLEGDALSSGILSRLDVAGFVTSPGLWLGLLACALFTAGAIWLRRYRDDS
jgi:ABC-2 type transport system permease protein